MPERMVPPEQVDDAGEPGADRLPEPGCTILCGADKPVPSGADRTDDGVPVVAEQVHAGDRGRDREEERENAHMVHEPIRRPATIAPTVLSQAFPIQSIAPVTTLPTCSHPVHDQPEMSSQFDARR